MKLLCVDLSAIIKTHLLLGLKTIASRSSRGNQSWFNLMTQSSTSLSQFCRMQCWILCFQLLTASSVRILVNEIVKPSLKNLWHASLRTSWPVDKNHLLKTHVISIRKLYLTPPHMITDNANFLKKPMIEKVPY